VSATCKYKEKAMNSVTISVSKHYGKTCWLAWITGTDIKYGYERDFEQASCKRTSRSGQTGTHDYVLVDPGLYQDSEGRLILVWQEASGGLKWCNIADERAKRIARLLDQGEEFEAARLATKPGPKPGSPDRRDRHAPRERRGESELSFCLADDDGNRAKTAFTISPKADGQRRALLGRLGQASKGSAVAFDGCS
jgi:hypothetical protein